MKLYYDLHMHTGLSPCGSDDMTPNNIVNMALIKELDCIAVTDHNTCKNVLPVIKAAQKINPDFIVIPGMEAETSEEIHVVCLFPDYETAEIFDGFIYSKLPNIKNEPNIFGRQIMFDEYDNEIGTEDLLLLNASSVDLYTMVKKVKEVGGVCIPAHIDRSSYSVISSLGFIPPDLDINIVEVSKKNDPVQFLFDNKRLIGRKLPYVQSSDAHYLWDMSEKERFLEINGACRTAYDIVEFLKSFNNNTAAVL